MKCEIIQDGKSCNNEAAVIVRTPWTTQRACLACRQSFKRYEILPCDEDGVEIVRHAPTPQPRVVQDVGGVVRLWCHCGKPGKFRLGVAGDDMMPLCDAHAPKPPSFLRKLVAAMRNLLERVTGARKRKAAAAEAELIRRVTDAKSQARRNRK